MYTGYLQLGGREITNTDRLYGYVHSAECVVPSFFQEPCGTLQEALGDSPYHADNIFDAPWYDPSNAELSSRFFGVAAYDISGVHDSTRSFSITQAIKDGGVIGDLRHSTKEVKVKAILLAQGQDALDFGLNWLNSQLEPGGCGQHGSACGFADLSFFTTCPPEMPRIYEEIPGEVVGTNYVLNPDVVPDGSQVTVAKNLFTNPRLKPTETWETMGRNLFTNPRLKGDGTWAEVRRNKIRRPIPVGDTTGFSPFNAVTLSVDSVNVHEAGASVRVDTTGAITGEGVGVSPLFGSTGAAGETETHSFWFKGPAGHAFTAYARERTSGGGLIASHEVYPVTATGDWQRISHTMTRSQADGVLVSQIGTGGSPAAVTFWVTEFLAETGDALGGYFDGSTMDESMVQPEDFRVRWLGVENASESVMEIERVAGLSALNCVAGVSTKDGKPAARIIPTGTPNGSRVVIVIPSAAQASGTLLGTLYLDQGLTGSLSFDSRRLKVGNPVARTDQSLNSAGTYPMRLTYTGLTSVYTAELWHGGAKGSGDVWWTDIGLFEGDYEGPAFNGSAIDFPRTDPDKWRVSWEGAEDASVSKLERLNARAEVQRNLFTNPRLKGDGTWAEVRRNLFSNPRVTSPIAAIDSNNSRTERQLIPGGGLRFIRREVGSSNAGVEARLPVEAGKHYVFSWVLTDDSGFSYFALLTNSYSSVEFTYGEAGIHRWASFTAPSTESLRARFRLVDVLDAEATVDFMMLENAPVFAPYFDGNTAPETAVGIVQPEDFRWRWLGAENASESVMEIERVQGLTANNCVAGVSMREGKPAVRLIPTGASADTFASFTLPEAARPSGTFIGTSHLEQAITGTLVGNSARRWSLTVLNPENGITPTLPNEPGSYPRRLSYTVDSYFNARLNHGGTQGSGDVWWTDIGLFAGTYNGGAFHGSSDPSDVDIVQPEDFTYRWLGAPDHSESVMEIETVRGFDLVISATTIAGVSTRAGKPALRLIQPGGFTTGSIGFTIPPGPARTSGTFTATSHVEPGFESFLVQGNTRVGRTIAALTPSTLSESPPDEKLVHRSIVHYSELSSDFAALLQNGGANPCEVWWTDIALFDRATGVNFFHAGMTEQELAAAGYEHPEDFTLEWEGAEDASASIMRAERVGQTVPGYYMFRSTFDGKPAIRLLRGDLGEQLTMGFLITDDGNPLPSSARGLGTLHLTEELDLPDGETGEAFARVIVGLSTNIRGESAHVTTPGSTPINFEATDLPLFRFYILQLRAKPMQSVWLTEPALTNIDYDGDPFSGSTQLPGNTPDFAFRWLGDENESHSEKYRVEWKVHDDDEKMAELMRPIERYMHDVAVTNGPTVREYLGNTQSPDGTKGALVEFTVSSERGFVYSRATPITLLTTPDAVEDAQRNRFLNPTADTIAASNTYWRRNFVPNPSLEENTTGWSGGASGTGGTPTYSALRAEGELRAVGDFSFKVQITGMGGASLAEAFVRWAQIVPADNRILLPGIWGALSDPNDVVTSFRAEYQLATDWIPLDEPLDLAAAKSGYSFKLPSRVSLGSQTTRLVSIRIIATGTGPFTLYGDAAMLIEG